MNKLLNFTSCPSACNISANFTRFLSRELCPMLYGITSTFDPCDLHTQHMRNSAHTHTRTAVRIVRFVETIKQTIDE